MREEPFWRFSISILLLSATVVTRIVYAGPLGCPGAMAFLGGKKKVSPGHLHGDRANPLHIDLNEFNLEGLRIKLAPAVAEPTRVDVEIVSAEAFAKWTAKDFRDRMNRPVIYNTGLHAKGVQRLNRVGDLSVGEQTLCARLMDLSSKRKFVNTENRRAAIAEAAAIEKELLKIHEKDLADGKYTLNDIKKAAAEQVGRDQVEAAAWMITLKDGTVITGEHTSRHFGHVSSGDMIPAWNGLTGGRGINLKDIAKVQWFHTHPTTALSAVPLSDGDGVFFKTFRQQLDKMGGKEIPFSIHAIYPASNTLVISSMSGRRP